MRKLWYGIRVVWLNAGFYSGFALLGLAFLCFGTVPGGLWLRYGQGLSPGETARRLIWWYGRAWGKLLASFVPLRLEGVASIPSGPCIFTPNHQSFFDAYCFGMLPARNLAFAVRSWPFRIPFYGPFMRAAQYMDTEAQDAGEMLSRAGELLRDGASLTVFPEGTRSPDGELGRFRSGAFHLAAATGVPVVPVCIEGTGGFLRKGAFLLRPAAVSVRVLDPVFPGQFAHLEDEVPLALRRAVKTRMRQALAELRREHDGAAAVCRKEYV